MKKMLKLAFVGVLGVPLLMLFTQSVYASAFIPKADQTEMRSESFQSEMEVEEPVKQMSSEIQPAVDENMNTMQDERRMWQENMEDTDEQMMEEREQLRQNPGNQMMDPDEDMREEPGMQDPGMMEQPGTMEEPGLMEEPGRTLQEGRLQLKDGKEIIIGTGKPVEETRVSDRVIIDP